MVTDARVKSEVHEITKQFFDRHENKLSVYGDALQFIHESTYEQNRLEAGSLGYPDFSKDILWLITVFGPQAPIDFDLLRPKQS